MQIGTLLLERERHGAAAGAEIEHARARAQSNRDLDEQLCLRARDQRARIDAQLQAAKRTPSDDVGDRLALDRASTHSVLEGTHRRTGYKQVGVAQQALASDAEHVREQQFAVQARCLTPGGGNRCDGTVERVPCRGAYLRRRVHQLHPSISRTSVTHLFERLGLQATALLV